MSDDAAPFPDLARLHERHRGLTEVVGRYYAEGAAVCLQRHHVSPTIVSVSVDHESPRTYMVSWPAPTARQLAAWDNSDDATRDAAYGIVIAAAEVYLGLFVMSRAERRSGSDYVVSALPYDSPDGIDLDFERAQPFRLEVSGTNNANAAQLDALAREKLEQLRRGTSSLPGIAGVVAYNLARIRFRRL